MRILYTLFLTAMVAITMERCRGEYLLVAVEDEDDFRKPKNDDFRKEDVGFRKPTNDDSRAKKSRRCFDCEMVIGGICCKFGNGTERCAIPENCPTYGKETRVINKIDCEKIKEELMSDNNGGEHLVCNPKGKPDCSTLKLSSTDPAVVDAPVVRDALTGTYQFIGEWKNVGTPIYRQVDGDPMSVWANKFYLYHSSKQWFVQKKSIGASKHHYLHSKHCKVDDYEDCSGKWKEYRTTKSYNINIECETTEDKDDLIVVDKKKMCLLDCPPGEMCFPTQPPMCGPPLENAETPKEESEMPSRTHCPGGCPIGTICCLDGTDRCKPSVFNCNF